MADTSGTSHAVAVRKYQSAQRLWRDRRPASMREAVSRFRSALEHDPEYGKAWSGLSTALVMNSFGSQYAPPGDTMPDAISAARRAIALDPDGRFPWTADAHAALGCALHAYRWDGEGAERAFHNALKVNERSATARQWFAEFLAERGRCDEALEQVRLAIEAESDSPIAVARQCRVLYLAGRYDEAIAKGLESVELHPEFIKGRPFLAQALAMAGRPNEAVTVLEQALQHAGGHLVILGELGWACGLNDERDRAHAILTELAAAPGRGHYVSPFVRGRVFAGMGDYSGACEAFRQALSERSCWMPSLSTDPAFRAIRSESKDCQRIIERVQPQGDGELR